jgi:hypothetical protein
MRKPADWERDADACFKFPTFGANVAPNLPTAYTKRPGTPEDRGVSERYVTGTIARIYGSLLADKFANVTLEGSTMTERNGELLKRFRAFGWVQPWTTRAAESEQNARFDGVPMPPAFTEAEVRALSARGNSTPMTDGALHGGAAWSLVTNAAWQLSWHGLLGTRWEEWNAFGDDYNRWRRTPAEHRLWLERDIIARRMMAVAMQPAVMVLSMWARVLRSPLLADLLQKWGDPVKIAQLQERLAKIETLRIDPIFGEILQAYGTSTVETPWGTNQVVTIDPTIASVLFDPGAIDDTGRLVDVQSTRSVVGASAWAPPPATAQLKRERVLTSVFKAVMDSATDVERFMFYAGAESSSTMANAMDWMGSKLGWQALPGDTVCYPYQLANEQPIEVMRDGMTAAPMPIAHLRHRLYDDARDLRRAFDTAEIGPEEVTPEVAVPTNQEGAVYLELSLRFSPLDWVAFASPVQDFGDRSECIELTEAQVRTLGNWPVADEARGSATDPFINEILTNPGAWAHLFTLRQAKADVMQADAFEVRRARDIDGEEVRYAFSWPGARLINRGVSYTASVWLPSWVTIFQSGQARMTAPVRTQGLTDTHLSQLRATWLQVGEASAK